MSKRILIIGAGGHGRVVSEVTQDCGYDEIAFLDDNSDLAIGKISDIKNFKDRYTDVFIGIGNNKVREKLLMEIKTLGFNIPALIHSFIHHHI